MIQIILNGLTVEQYFGYLIYLFLGMLIAYLAERIKYATPIKRSGGFKMATWVQENWKRVLLTMLCVHVVAVFMEKIVGAEASIWQALLVGGTFGYTIDGIVDMIAKKKS